MQDLKKWILITTAFVHRSLTDTEVGINWGVTWQQDICLCVALSLHSSWTGCLLRHTVTLVVVRDRSSLIYSSSQLQAQIVDLIEQAKSFRMMHLFFVSEDGSDLIHPSTANKWHAVHDVLMNWLSLSSRSLSPSHLLYAAALLLW